mgnify:CR=1 FL=1
MIRNSLKVARLLLSKPRASGDDPPIDLASPDD